MPCSIIITGIEGVRRETDPPHKMEVTGTAEGCDRVEAWIVNIRESSESQHVQADVDGGGWTAFFDEDEHFTPGLFACGRTDLEIRAFCVDDPSCEAAPLKVNNLTCRTERECPSRVRLEVRDAGGELVDPEEYLGSGSFTVVVVEPEGDDFSFTWSVDGELREYGPSEEFSYNLVEGDHDISVAVVLEGCPPITGNVTLQGPRAVEAPTETPVVTIPAEEEEEEEIPPVPGRPDGGLIPCWLVHMVLAAAIIVTFTTAAFALCLPYAGIVSLIGLLVGVVAFIMSALMCDRCGMLRTLAWSIYVTIIVLGLELPICPQGALPVGAVLGLFLTLVVIPAINRIKGCRVPGLRDIPFCVRIDSKV